MTDGLSFLNRKICIILLLVYADFSTGAGYNVKLDDVNVDYEDTQSLQNGLATFSHYCMGCHSLGYQRYERTAIDLGINLEDMTRALVPEQKKIGDLGSIAMPAEQSAQWFGISPPDLTLVARKRSPEWIYTYMRSFYSDVSRPLGVDNLVYPKVGMPHVLEPLQGVQELNCDESGVCNKLVLVEGTGSLDKDEYDQTIRDLVNFLEYVGEPSKAKAHSVGVYVLFFIMIFFVFAYFLKREYWKDVH